MKGFGLVCGGGEGLTAKNFAAFGGLYGAASCALERVRGTKDIFNGTIAACAAGGVIGAKSYPPPCRLTPQRRGRKLRCRRVAFAR